MSVQQEESEEVFVHQYMCSECHQLFNTLEEVLQHQQSHMGPEEEEEETEPGAHLAHLGEAEDGDTNYQCLECGALLRNPEELLLHQEMHMREAGLDGEHEVCEVLEADVDPSVSGAVQYQCLECLALFPSPELWLQHRHTHNKSSTHSQHSNTEYVVQADGSVTPLVNVQNLVLDEQRAGEILAQVLAQQQHTGPSRALLPPVAPMAGSATLRLQICSAQALADAHTHTHTLTHTHTPTDASAGSNPLRRSCLLPPPLLASTAASLQTHTLTHTPAHTHTPGQAAGRMHPYECSECSLEFSTPEDFLAHQGEHFLCQEKESAEGGVMDEQRGDAHNTDITTATASQAAAVAVRQPITVRSAPDGGVSLQCGECQRTFTSANRLAAHRRVHEQGTHECSECGKVFKKAGSLQTHLRSHSGEARYLCVDCGHGFTTEMTLIIHRKSHTAEPLHRCEFCAKTFTNMTKFLYHRRTHTARPPLTAVSTQVFVPPRRAGPALSLQERLRERQRVGLMQPSQSETQVGGSNALAQPPGLIAPMSEAAAPAEDRYGNMSKQNGVVEDRYGNISNGVVVCSAVEQERAIDCAVSGEKLPEGATASAEEEGEAAFPCPACSKAFRTQLRLVRHRRTVHVSERLFRCGVCAKSFKKQIHVQNHLRTHTGERPFQCSDCGKTFASLANLSRHALTHTGERPYRCPVCSRAFSQSSNLRQHQLLHANTPPSRCPDCPATFRRAAKLTAHRHTHHQGPAPYPCPHCPEGFLRKRQRDLHCQAQHPHTPAHTHTAAHTHTDAPQASGAIGSAAATPEQGEGPDAQKVAAVSRPFPDGSEPIGSASRPSLDCSVCGKRLNSASNLRLHMLSHGEGAGSGRRHQCGVCGKAFVSASGLGLHRRVHTGERPFPCGVCGKRFRQNTHLREHLRTHSGERPFRCETCGKGFVQSMHLAEHRRTHTGERPHGCHCGKAFKTISNLRNHQKIHTRALLQQQQQQQQEAEGGGHGDLGEAGAAVAVLDAAAVLEGAVELSAAVPALCQQGALGQPQLIHIQTADLAQGAPTIMCNEFGEAIAIIETSEGAALPLAEALEIYQTALESSITVDNLQLL